MFTATVQEFMSHANTALINYYNSIVPNGADYILRVRGLTHDKDFSEKDVVSLFVCLFVCVFVNFLVFALISDVHFFSVQDLSLIHI